MTRPFPRTLGGIRTLLFVALWSVTAGQQLGYAATEVNVCGQTFKGSGFLSGDLDCTGFPGDAVTIDGGRLDLRGFTITLDGGGFPVLCTKGCYIYSDLPGGTVLGPGFLVSVNADAGGVGRANLRVVGIAVNGSVISADGSLKVEDSTITNAISIQGGIDRPVKIRGSVVDTTTQEGVLAGKVKVFDSMILNAGTTGVSASRAVLRNVTIDGSGGRGISSGGPVKVEGCTITNNGDDGIGASGVTVKVIDSTVSTNGGSGIDVATGSGQRVTILNSTIDGNALDGVLADGQRLRVDNSFIVNNARNGVRTDGMLNCYPQKLTGTSITGNGTDLSCGVAETCADVASCIAPKLTATACDTSYDTQSGFPGTSWGICSLD